MDLGRQGPNDFFNGLLEQVPSVCSGLRPLRPAGFIPARPYQSECAAGGRYGALKEGVAVGARSGPPDSFRRGRIRARSPQATRRGEVWPEAATERSKQL